MNKSETDSSLSSKANGPVPVFTVNAPSVSTPVPPSPAAVPNKRTAFKQGLFKLMSQINIIKPETEKGKEENGDDTASLASTTTGQSFVSTSTALSDVYKNGELARRREKKKLAKHKIEGWLGNHKPYIEFLDYLAFDELKASLDDSSIGETLTSPPATPTPSVNSSSNNPAPTPAPSKYQQVVVRPAADSDQSTDDDEETFGDTDEPEASDDLQKLLQLKLQTAPSQQSQLRRQLEKDSEFRTKLQLTNRFKILDIDVELEQDFLADLNQINPLEIIDINNEYICYTNKFYQMNHFNFIGKYEYEKSRTPSASRLPGDSMGESEDFDEYDFHSPSQGSRRESADYDKPDSVFVLSLHSESKNEIECIWRTRIGNKTGMVELQEGESWNVTKILGKLDKNMIIKEVKPVIHPHATELIANFDSRLVKPNFTFGIVYQKLGQMDEKEIFNNNNHSREFDEFLEFIGRKVELRNFQGFRGGLDKANNTGEYSIYEEFSSSEIMFHVSTMLPHSARDTQQIERKRHIGNDRVCIVFQDEYTPFTPEMLPTNLLHVFIVVQPGKLDDGSRCYQLTVISKSDVPDIEPFIRKPYVFKKDEYLKKFLLTKLINAEYASLKAKAFSKFQIKTMDIWLRDLYESLKKLSLEFTGEDFATCGNVEKQLVNSISSISAGQQHQLLSAPSASTNRLSPNGPIAPADPSVPVISPSLNQAFSAYSVTHQYLIIKNLEFIFKQHLQNDPSVIGTLTDQLAGSETGRPGGGKNLYAKQKGSMMRRFGDTFSLTSSKQSSFKMPESESTHSIDSFDSAVTVSSPASATATAPASVMTAPGSPMTSESNLYKQSVLRSKKLARKAEADEQQQKRSTLTAEPDESSSSSGVYSQTYDGQSKKDIKKENFKKFTNIVVSSEKYQVSDRRKLATKPSTLTMLTTTAHKPLNTVKSALPKQVAVLDFGTDSNAETAAAASDSDSEATQKDLPSPPASSGGSKTITDLFRRLGQRKRDDQHAKLSESSSSRRRRSLESEEQQQQQKHSGDQLKTKF